MTTLTITMRINREIECVMITRIALSAVLCLFIFSQSSCSPTRVGAMNYQDESETSKDALRYYSSQSVMTDPGKYVQLYDDLPNDIPELCQVVQGLLIHVYHAQRYGVTLSSERKEEVDIRRVEEILERIVELDNSSLARPREPRNRVVGNCRDFTVLICSFLRHNGIPARARSGFRTYFTPGFYEDHWICEYWSQSRKRWIQVDAQLDSIQKRDFALDFDSLDLPKGKFLYAGTVYRLCMEGEIDPDKCGINDLSGLWFVRGNLIRDLMALNKMEVLPWDETELMDEQKHPHREISALIETIIDLTTSHEDRLSEIRMIYQKHPGLRMPSGWKP